MNYGIPHTLQRLFAGQTLARIYMNTALAKETLRGKVVDIGGGRSPDYFSYLHTEEGATIEAADMSLGPINFEKDALPYESGSIDTVLMCNILEHIYNHMHLLRETKRIMRPGARLIGYVPFWIGYHPDPHDYFRYTHEALEKMLTESGFEDITVSRTGKGPITANFNTIVLSLPRVVRPIVYIPYALLDRLFLMLRPASAIRNPLGYIFTAKAR